jgi:hypothetical protein
MSWNEIATLLIVYAIIAAIALVTRGQPVPRDPTERYDAAQRHGKADRHEP